MEERQKSAEKEQYEARENEKTDSSLDQEIKAGEWQNLKRFEIYRKRGRQGKIIATHQALANRIKQLETLFYQLVANHPEKATKLLSEIKRLRFLLEYLLQALIWEERGEFDDHATPDELEGLV